VYSGPSLISNELLDKVDDTVAADFETKLD